MEEGGEEAEQEDMVTAPRNTKSVKADLIAATAMASGHNQNYCARVVEKFLKALPEFAYDHGPIELRCFGTFCVKERKPRPARNPRTGAVVMIPSRLVFLFQFSPDLVGAIADGLGVPYATHARFDRDRLKNLSAHARSVRMARAQVVVTPENIPTSEV